MLLSRLFTKTLRDKPRNADSVSHQLLLRAGFLRPTSAGGFLLLPLGQRVLRHIQHIVAGELADTGAIPVGFPAARASDLSRSLRLRRHEANADYPFASEHESSLAALGGNLAVSYRDLPLILATTRSATRDDSHPNWGLLSAPDFSFHATYSFAGSLDPIRAAYLRALAHIGVDPITLGNEWALETALAARPILACGHCTYRSPVDTAVSRTPEWPQIPEPGETVAVFGPGLIGVEPLAKFLGIPVHQTSKTMLFDTGDRIVAAVVAGIYGVSEPKLCRVLGCKSLALAAPEIVRELTNSEVGYAGPVGLPAHVEVIWDLSTEHRTNFEAGANQTDHHRININFGRDLPRPEKFHDIRTAQPGELCAQCDSGTLTASAALPLGHATELGDTYSELLGARYLDSDKATRPLPIACAGLDLSATLAAVVEQHHDDRGIVWPAAVAPFAVHLISLPPAESATEALYRELTARHVSVLWDDRPESPGVKFGDADLIGIPTRLVLSKRTGDKIEWKARSASDSELLTKDEVLSR